MISFERYVKAATSFVKHQSHEVLDVNDDKEEFINLIYKDKDNENLVFVHVSDKLNDEIPNARIKFEFAVIDYLTENLDIDQTKLRYDVIAVKYLGKDKALLRHHMNAINIG